MAKETTVEGPPEYIEHNGKVWSYLESGGFRGYVPCEDPRPVIPKEQPTMHWDGGRISLVLWQQILAFFEWSQKEFKSEAQVRLYYHRTTKKWTAWAYPQEPNGMTTKELEDHPDVAKQRAQFKDPWILFGTVHHHCTSGAFQSATDTANEHNQEGIHITVGGISTVEYSTHSRIIVRNSQYDNVNLARWFEMPQSASGFPWALQIKILDYFIKSPPPDDTAFPEQWKANCIKKPVVVYNSQRDSSSTHHTSGAAASIGRSCIPVKTDLKSQFTNPELQFMREALATMNAMKVSHNQADVALNVAEWKLLSKADKDVVTAIEMSATVHKISDEKLDELFDIWDFEVVLAELFPRPNNLQQTTNAA